MKPTYPIWILISDASRARLYSVASEHRPLVLHKEFEHAASRARELDLVTDKPGRTNQSMGSGGHPGHGSRSSMEPGTSAKAMEHDRFARSLAEELNLEFNRNSYARLLIAANPEFLGLLREHLSEPVKRNLAGSLNKDYTSLGDKELEEHLGPLLAA